MITFSKKIQDYRENEQIFLVEGTCLHDDTKPTDVANGSCLIEMDTGDVYFFDEQNKTWRKLE